MQDFEAALKQRDGIITQLTANLQQAREEKDEIMKEFLELTEQSQMLQIQFQQVGVLPTVIYLGVPRCDRLLLCSHILIFVHLIIPVKSQLQAGETLRNTSHSSTAADLFQARQQLSLYQQQVEELNDEMKNHHESSREQLQKIEELQNKLGETEMVSGFIGFTGRMCSSIKYFDFVSVITVWFIFCSREEKQKSSSHKA